MPPCALSWTPAGPADIAVLLVLMRAFYTEEHLNYEEQHASRALADLLATPSLGTAFILRGGNGEALGYSIATYGYSIEFGGRYALLDELYLDTAARGRGEGTRALDVFEKWSADQGVAATRLEVTAHNEKARAIYGKRGYLDDGRSILTRWNLT